MVLQLQITRACYENSWDNLLQEFSITELNSSLLEQYIYRIAETTMLPLPILRLTNIITVRTPKVW